MKIAMVSLYLPSGSKIGSGHQAHHLANELVRYGHQVVMHSPCEKPSTSSYDHIQIDVGRRNRTFRFAWEVRGQRFDNFDVVHAHGDDYLLIGGSRPPHVRTMHGSCLAEALHIRGGKERLRMGLLGASEVLSTLVADVTVAVSANTTRWYPWIKRVIPNGLDLTVFNPGPKTDKPTILFVGTYRRRKRGWLLARSFVEEVLPQFPDAELLMVSEDVPCLPRVRALGRVPDEELASLYRSSWIFCLPSSYEGFGIPYVEAMASGTAVVATPNPGALEVLDAGRYGLLTPAERLGSTLVTLLNDAPRREAMAGAGLRRSQQYGWPKIVDQYMEAYAAAGA